MSASLLPVHWAPPAKMKSMGIAVFVLLEEQDQSVKKVRYICIYIMCKLMRLALYTF